MSVNIKTGALSGIHSSKTYKYISRYIWVYLLVIPGVVHTYLFSYRPMYGILIAFKNFNYRLGVWKSPWNGLENFQNLFNDQMFLRAVRNTLIINLINIPVGTIVVVFLALMLNEIRHMITKKLVQTAVYLPHFLSWTIFAGLVVAFLSPSTGPINILIRLLGGEPVYFLTEASYTRIIYIVSGLFKEAGFGTIIYLAAISGVNPELYQAATIEGAHRGHMMKYITLPRIYPTIAVLLLLRIASLFGSNFEQVVLLYNPLTYETGDVISTYLYRSGLLEGRFASATAMGLVFNVISLAAVLTTNKLISKLEVMGLF